MTKKVHRKFCWISTEFVLEKGQLGKYFIDSERCSEIGGNLKYGGNASLALGGMAAPETIK